MIELELERTNGKDIYTNIMNTLKMSVHNFYNAFGRNPNKVMLSRDVVNYLLGCNKDILLNYAEPTALTIMGMKVEEVYNKKGFIEVCYSLPIPYRVNIDYMKGE